LDFMCRFGAFVSAPQNRVSRQRRPALAAERQIKRSSEESAEMARPRLLTALILATAFLADGGRSFPIQRMFIGVTGAFVIGSVVAGDFPQVVERV
jgi:hypothetical protein